MKKNYGYVRCRFISMKDGLDLRTARTVISVNPLDGDDLDQAFATACRAQKSEKKPVLYDYDTKTATVKK